MANQNNKRKLEEISQHPTFGMPHLKHRNVIGTFPGNNVTHRALPARATHEAIEIKDESDDETKSSISPLMESRGDLKGLLVAVSNHEEEIKQTRQVEETLRDQIADWSLCTLRLEAMIAELSNSVNDTTALDSFKDSVLLMIPDDAKNEEKLRDLNQRLEIMEEKFENQGKAPALGVFSRDALARVAPGFKSTRSSKDNMLLSSKLLRRPELELGPITGSSLSERKPTTIKTASTPGSTTISLSFPLPPAISQLGLSEADWAEPAAVPALSNSGLEKLLRNVDFSNPAHLRALSDLDSRDHPRDIILFCDSHTFTMFRVDYMIIGGRLGSYIMDHPSCGPPRSGGLGKAGLGQLRALELNFGPLNGITGTAGSRGGPFSGRGASGSSASNGSNNNRSSSNSSDEEAAIQEWKERVGAPAYVYELGQLFLRRKGQDRFDVQPTQYNAVVDMGSRDKGVWLVMRPEYPSAATWRKESKDSTVPFRTNMASPHGVAVGRFAARLADLGLATPPFSFESRDAFHDAQTELADTAHKGKVRLLFRAPDHEHMMRTLAAGWAGGGGGGGGED